VLVPAVAREIVVAPMGSAAAGGAAVAAVGAEGASICGCAGAASRKLQEER